VTAIELMCELKKNSFTHVDNQKNNVYLQPLCDMGSMKEEFTLKGLETSTTNILESFCWMLINFCLCKVVCGDNF